MNYGWRWNACTRPGSLQGMLFTVSKKYAAYHGCWNLLHDMRGHCALWYTVMNYSKAIKYINRDDVFRLGLGGFQSHLNIYKTWLQPNISVLLNGYFRMQQEPKVIKMCLSVGVTFVARKMWPRARRRNMFMSTCMHARLHICIWVCILALFPVCVCVCVCVCVWEREGWWKCGDSASEAAAAPLRGVNTRPDTCFFPPKMNYGTEPSARYSPHTADNRGHGWRPEEGQEWGWHYREHPNNKISRARRHEGYESLFALTDSLIMGEWDPDILLRCVRRSAGWCNSIKIARESHLNLMKYSLLCLDNSQSKYCIGRGVVVLIYHESRVLCSALAVVTPQSTTTIFSRSTRKSSSTTRSMNQHQCVLQTNLLLVGEKKKKKTRLETGCNRLTHLFMFHAKWLLLLSTHICTLSTRALIWYIMTNVYQLGCGCLCQIWATAPEKKRGEQEGERERERERESMWLFAAVCEQLSLHPCAHLCPPMSQAAKLECQTLRCRADKLADRAPSVPLKAFRLIFSGSVFA